MCPPIWLAPDHPSYHVPTHSLNLTISTSVILFLLTPTECTIHVTYMSSHLTGPRPPLLPCPWPLNLTVTKPLIWFSTHPNRMHHTVHVILPPYWPQTTPFPMFPPPPWTLPLVTLWPSFLLTPTECTIHFGGPVVPDEYMINSGWLKGTWANSRTGLSSANLENSESKILRKKTKFMNKKLGY